MAHLLAKFGKQALQPRLVNGVWHKAAISARMAAKLRKEALLAGEPWPFDDPPKSEVIPRKPKGHKHDRLKPARQQMIAEKLEKMDEMIAESRRKRREIKAPLADRLFLTKRELRSKHRGSWQN